MLNSKAPIHPKNTVGARHPLTGTYEADRRENKSPPTITTIGNNSRGHRSSSPLLLRLPPLSHTFVLLRGFMVFRCTGHVNKAERAAFN